jgi:type II secretory pathway pseudopilin PulG
VIIVAGMIILALWLLTLASNAQKSQREQEQQRAIDTAVAEATKSMKAPAAAGAKKRTSSGASTSKKLVFRDLEAEKELEPLPEPKGTYVYDSAQHKVIFVPA